MGLLLKMDRSMFRRVTGGLAAEGLYPEYTTDATKAHVARINIAYYPLETINGVEE